MHPALSTFIRRCTSRIVFTKRLPKAFGSLPLYVAPRADLRVLYPGYRASGLDLMLVAEHFVEPGACVWDIGSNQGIFAACAAAKAGPTGKVFSVEADPAYAALQHRSFSRFSSAVAPCSVLAAAISDAVSLLDFAVSAKGHARSGIASVSDGPIAAHKPVVSVTLDFLLEHWPAPNVVKIDVEGADFMALSGAPRLLRDARPLVYIEMTPQTRARSSQILNDAGYRLSRLTGDGTLAPIEQHTPYVIAQPAQPI